MGLNEAARLAAAGIGVKKADVSRVPLAAIRIVTKGPTAHPRRDWPVDRSLVDHIKIHGIPTNEQAFTGRQAGDEIEVENGCRRTMAARVAEKELRRDAPRKWPLEAPRGGWTNETDPGGLFVACTIVVCEDLDLILGRLAANVSHAEPDTKSVLAAIVGSIVKLNRGEPDAALMARIVAAMPRGVGPAEVLALVQWPSLGPQLQAMLDDPAVPIGVLPAIVNARPEDREGLLSRLLAAGVKSTRGATRKVRAEKDERDPWARRMSPRQAVRLANALFDDIAPEVPIATAKAYIAIGLRIGSSREPKKLLSTLPTKLRSALEAARVSKAGAK